MHQDDLESGEVIELGPTIPGQESLFERMRTRISHGHVLSKTLDEAIKRRCNINTWDDERDRMPKQVDEATFDADVKKILSFTPNQLEEFDNEVCYARGERRDSRSNGIFVCREGSGFGRDVFGVAYDGISGKWTMTNQMGLHSHCEEHLRMKIGFESEVKRKDLNTAIISGFIFKLPSLETPIMTPHGWPYLPSESLTKALEELWSWKMFIILHDQDPVKPTKEYRWGKSLFTPEVALQAQKAFCE
jgi:hypothetical protein